MPLYRYEIEFEAEDDEEAQDFIYNEGYGVINSFFSFENEKLEHADGTRLT